jgi:peroxin-11B
MIGQTSLPVEPWLKFLSSTAGRDKFYRTVQYLSRFLAYYLSSNPDAAKRFQALSVAVGLGRKRTHFYLMTL